MAPKSNPFSAAILGDRPLRANPAFDLVLFDRLPESEQRLLGALAQDPEHYGVLRPRDGSGLGPKAVDRETALLFLTLAQAGPLPRYVRRRLGEKDAGDALVRLVADGVLEVEATAGHFVSGAAAMTALGTERVAGSAGSGGRGDRIVELSHAALLYGERLARIAPGAEPLWLSWRLYGYHRRPLTPRWRQTLPDAAAVERFLGLGANGEHGATRQLLERHWRPREPQDPEMKAADTVWLRWRPLLEGSRTRTRTAGTGGEERPATYKLYVSPATEALPAACGGILAGLAAAGAPGFKVGATAGGLLRPDKFVAYFASFDHLAEAAAAVGERLAGIAAHGVPFTSEIAGDGLLSWGVDPPPSPLGTALPWTATMSWRLWITHRLARALLDAVRTEDDSGPAAEAWRFALERLRLDGVDTDSWTPAAGLWQPGRGAAMQ